MTTLKMYKKIVLVLSIQFLTFYSIAQLSTTSFESFADGHNFVQANWNSEGFTTSWVNGFNANRAQIDDAFAVSGTMSLRILYPANNFGPVNTGAQAPLMITPAIQYYISYWVRFSDNFSWGNSNEGGKLPGLSGGGTSGGGCSGCATCNGANGFSARLMWRTGGRLVLYLYHMDKPGGCGEDINLRPLGVNFFASRGQWIKITQRVRVNTGNNSNGEVELWVNEQPALLRTGIRFLNNGNLINNFYFSTFHGGNDATWSPTVNCYTWFDDIIISTNPSDIFTALQLSDDDSNAKEDVPSTPLFDLFPMPVKAGESFTLTNRSDEMPHLLEWVDLTGKSVFSQRVTPGAQSFLAPTLQNGMYLIKLYYPSKVDTRKVHLAE